MSRITDFLIFFVFFPPPANFYWALRPLLLTIYIWHTVEPVIGDLTKSNRTSQHIINKRQQILLLRKNVIFNYFIISYFHTLDEITRYVKKKAHHIHSIYPPVNTLETCASLTRRVFWANFCVHRIAMETILIVRIFRLKKKHLYFVPKIQISLIIIKGLLDKMIARHCWRMQACEMPKFSRKQNVRGARLRLRTIE